MFYDTFHKLCLDKGVSDSRACTDMGLSRSYAAKMKNKDGTPSMDSLSAMSEYFGVSVDYLLHGDEPQKEKPTAQGGELTEKDVALINMKPLTEEQKQQAMDIAKRIDICVKESGMKKNRVLRKIRYFVRKFQLLESRNKLPSSKKTC
ncbi:MAG: helix-turn-helix domain-containing protein [Subdoligranulum sp.]